MTCTTETKTITTRARICPTDRNYRMSDWNMIYDLLHYWRNVEFDDKCSLVELDCKNSNNEERRYKIRFSSERAFKRCKRMFSEWYYEKLPFDKEWFHLF